MRFVSLATVAAAGLVAVLSASAQSVAPMPPMGWNSWDAYGLTITEAQFRANVEVLRRDLLPSGWQYAVIDEGWFMQNPQDRPQPEKMVYQLDGYGRYVPVPSRFPTAEPALTAEAAVRDDVHSVVDKDNKGFTELGSWVHAQGLKFGIHIVRGIPRESVKRGLPIEGSTLTLADAADTTDACPWDPTNWGVKDNEAGQAWYDALLRQYAGWGVDLLKVDCISDHPYKVSEIRQIRRAIDKTGRPIVLSLSPGPTALEHAEEVGKLAQMWRISDDIWDIWKKPGAGFPQTVTSQFARLADWEKYVKPGNWPDADMLPLGELWPSPGWGKPRTSRLAADEQRTQFTLWCMARSPLILGANLTSLDPTLLKMLQNPDLIRIDQTASAGRQAWRQGDLVAWTADLPSGETALAIFNLADTPADIHKSFAELGAKTRVRRVTTPLPVDATVDKGSLSAKLAPHASGVWILH